MTLAKTSILFTLFALLSTQSISQTNSDKGENLLNHLTDVIHSAPLDETQRIIDSTLNSYGIDTLRVEFAIGLYIKAYVLDRALEEFERSIAKNHRAIDILDRLDTTNTFNRFLKATILSRIGNTYHITSDLKGVDYLLKSNAIFRELGRYARVASNYRTLSTYFQTTTGIDPMLTMQEQSMHYIQLDENHTQTDLAYGYRGIGHIYNETDSDSCLHYFTKAYYTLMEDSLATDSDKLNLAAGVAEIAIRNNRFDIAERYTPIAYRLSKVLYGEESVITAHIYFQFLQIHGHYGNTDSVNYYKKKGFEIYDRQGEKFIWRINAFNHLNKIETQKGNYQKALEYAHKAMFVNAPYTPEPECVHELLPLDSTYYSYEKLGNAISYKLNIYRLMYLKSGKPEDLLRAYRANIHLLDFFLNVHYKNSISIDRKSNMFNRAIEETISHLLWITTEAQAKGVEGIDVKKSYTYFSLLKAGLLHEINRENSGHGDYPLSTIRTIDSLRSEISRLQFDKAFASFDRESHYRINRELEGLYISLLRLRSRQIEPDNTPIPIITPETILSSISPNQAIIDYFYNDSTLYCFVAKDSDISIVSSRIDVSVETKLQDYLRNLKTSSSGLPNSQQRLYALLIEPIEGLVEGKDALVIIPYHYLHSTPFEPIIDPAGNYMISRFAISYNYSSRFKTLSKHKSPNSIIAYVPSFSQEASIAEDLRGLLPSNTPFKELEFLDLQKGTIANLPFTEIEANAIAEAFPGITTVVSGCNATKDHFLAHSPNNQIIHIASHGYGSSNHIELSGIFFSHHNESSLEDSYLFIREVAQAQFNANLVVLSACQTGKGVVEGMEGTIALPRAFFGTGVPNILSSLWKVNDKHTMLLMKYFYGFLAQGNSYSKALQKAKLECINQGMLPLDWSSFTLIGE